MYIYNYVFIYIYIYRSGELWGVVLKLISDRKLEKMKCKTHWENQNHKKYNPCWDLSNPLFQKKWVTDHDNNIIVKEIYPFDKFEEILEKKFNCKVEHLNKTEKKEDINNETITKIRQIFKEDIEFYNNLLI